MELQENWRLKYSVPVSAMQNLISLDCSDLEGGTESGGGRTKARNL